MLKGKCAVVTGASRGIGAAIALDFLKKGANVAAIYAGNEEAAKEVLKKAEEFEGECKIYKCDVSDFAQSADTVKQIIEDFGGIDILVNNAGVTRDKLVLQMNEEDFDKVIDINLKGAFNMIKHCYRNFMKRKYGKIINVSSVSGIMGNPGQANYSASKAGIIGLTKTVAKELASRNVCCNAIAPGFVKTDMTKDFEDNKEVYDMIPLKRMANPGEIANLASFLADDLSDYITGEVIRIDGGLAM